MSQYQFGEYAREGRLLDERQVDATAGAVSVATDPGNIARTDAMTYQLITENIVSADVPIGASDTSVVASTKTWTIPGYNFTGQVGATIHVRGDVAHTGNNGDFVVSSVTSAHVVVTTTASGLADETFDPATTTITIERTDAPLQGSWTIEVSNIYSGVGAGNDRANSWDDSKPTDITTAFVLADGSPAIVAVTDVSNQAVQAAPFAFRAHRVTFDATEGIGLVSVYTYQKGT